MNTVFRIAAVAGLQLALFSSSLYAGSGWSGATTVTGIYVLDENRAIVKLANFSNQGGCLINGDGDVFINPTTQKAWFTMLLTAYTTKQTVDIYVGPSCTGIWAGTSFADTAHVRLR